MAFTLPFHHQNIQEFDRWKTVRQSDRDKGNISSTNTHTKNSSLFQLLSLFLDFMSFLQNLVIIFFQAWKKVRGKFHDCTRLQEPLLCWPIYVKILLRFFARHPSHPIQRELGSKASDGKGKCVHVSKVRNIWSYVWTSWIEWHFPDMAEIRRHGQQYRPSGKICHVWFCLFQGLLCCTIKNV